MDEKILCSSTSHPAYKEIYWLIIGIASVIYLSILHKNAGVPYEQLGWLCGLICIGAFYIIHLYLFNNTMTVTDKRVYGKTAFGKRVDLPLTKISAVSCSPMGSIGVSTASGVINFYFLMNHEEIHRTITNLLLNKINS